MKKDKKSKKTKKKRYEKSIKEARDQYREWLKYMINDDYLHGLGVASYYKTIRAMSEGY